MSSQEWVDALAAPRIPFDELLVAETHLLTAGERLIHGGNGHVLPLSMASLANGPMLGPSQFGRRSGGASIVEHTWPDIELSGRPSRHFGSM